MEATEFFYELLTKTEGAEAGKMFGAVCAKMLNGKAGMMLKDDFLLVKIPEESAADEGFKVFTPIENRPMKGWYEIPYGRREVWEKYAAISCETVSKLEPNKKKK